MKIKRNIWIYAITFLFLSFAHLYADQCDDVFEKAHKLFDSAKEAVTNKNYNQAIEYYKEAMEYYEQVANMQNCGCPTISKNARENAALSRRLSEEYQVWLDKYKAESQIYEEYNRAKEKYNEGNAYARNKEWDQAIAAFEEAAQIWENVANSSQSENGKKASEMAKQAHGAADLARKHKQ